MSLKAFTSVVGAVALVGLGAGTASAAPYAPAASASAVNPSSFTLVQYATIAGGCDDALLDVRLSISTPADVAAQVYSSSPVGHTCTGWVERSPRTTNEWTVASAKISVPSVSGDGAFANTGLVYDGQKFKARVCVQASGSSKVSCSSAEELAAGSETATSPAQPVSYVHKTANEVRVSSGGEFLGSCYGWLAGSTETKKTGTSVVSEVQAEGDPCTAWIETTANGGTTWTTVSPVISFNGAAISSGVVAFTAHYADNPGHLARVCVKDMVSKKLNCSGIW